MFGVLFAAGSVSFARRQRRPAEEIKLTAGEPVHHLRVREQMAILINVTERNPGGGQASPIILLR